MYVTIKEISEFLNLPERYIMEKVHNGKIKTVYDGRQLLVNKSHFEKTKDIIEKELKMLEMELEEPILEDYDIKDED